MQRRNSKKTVSNSFSSKAKKSVSGKTGSKEYSPEVMKKIQDRAYYIWLERGSPSGNDMDIWFAAEKEILGKKYK